MKILYVVHKFLPRYFSGTEIYTYNLAHEMHRRGHTVKVFCAEDVEKGQGLGKSLSKSEAFPALSVQMIEVGEQSGELEKMLIKMADVYEAEVESSVTSMTSLLEPIMILVMGTIVGFIVLSICLPIFEMNQLVG